MIMGIRRGLSAREARRRSGRPVQPPHGVVPPGGDGRSAGFGQSLPVAIEPAPERGRIVRLQTSSPFLAQLAVVHLDETGTPDRRLARRPDLVGPRASASYRGTERLATDIEPGFLVKREF